MNFVSSPDGSNISIVPVAKYFYSLVYNYIVHQKIGYSINSYAYSNVKYKVDFVNDAQIPEGCRRYSEDKGKPIILLKNIIVRFMMVAVQKPHKTMHDKFVGKPCNKFHKKESNNYRDNIDYDVHGLYYFKM